MHALQTGFDHRPFAGVDHEGNARDLGFSGQQMQEAHHSGGGIQHAFVHVDIDDLRAVVDLLERHSKRFVVTFIFDQAFEFRRAGDVGAFANVQKQAVATHFERLESGKTQLRRDVRNPTGRSTANGFRDRADMFGRGAATAAHKIKKAAACELVDNLGHHRRCFVVFTKGVG